MSKTRNIIIFFVSMCTSEMFGLGSYFSIPKTMQPRITATAKTFVIYRQTKRSKHEYRAKNQKNIYQKQPQMRKKSSRTGKPCRPYKH